jgi:hypothetical protein
MREVPSLHKHAVAHRASRTAWKIITQARADAAAPSNFAQNGPFLRKTVTPRDARLFVSSDRGLSAWRHGVDSAANGTSLPRSSFYDVFSV